VPVKAVVFVPAYEAAGTLERVFERLPAEVYERLDHILIQDDASADDTVAVARRIVEEHGKVELAVNDHNLGFGGTHKRAFRKLRDAPVDAVVVVHGDLQHPPERIPDLLGLLEHGDADVVLGSRMIGHPLRGGMPFYKWLANGLLTRMLNRALGLRLTDYHTGYVAMTTDALRRLPIDDFGDGHELTAELLIEAADRGLRIREVPVETHYGDGSRSCSLRTSVRYGIDVVRLLRRRRQAMGGSGADGEL
jgi:glycosyltransferase involved in cell wall biosynthesis